MERANITPIQNHLLAVIPVNTVKDKIFLPDLNTLKNKKITAIEIHSVTDVTIAPDGETVITDAVMKKSFLCLVSCSGGKEKIDRMPFNALYAKNNGGKVKSFAEDLYDYSKSYIQIGSTAGLTVGEVFLVSFFFED